MSTQQRPAGRSRPRLPSLRRLLVISATIAALAMLAPAASASPHRDKEFHLVKVCAAAGDSCTVTASNDKKIPAGTEITYADSSVWPTALVPTIHVQGGTATGLCDLSPIDAGTGPGKCVFTGGTGSLRHFRITVDVTTTDEFNPWFWDGTFDDGHGHRG